MNIDTTNTPKKIRAPRTAKASKQPRVAAPKKQQELAAPGMVAKRIPAVEDKANELRASRTERMELQKLEATQQDELVAVMREHGVKLYKFEGEEDELIVEIKDKTKVQVRKATTIKSEDE